MFEVPPDVVDEWKPLLVSGRGKDVGAAFEMLGVAEEDLEAAMSLSFPLEVVESEGAPDDGILMIMALNPGDASAEEFIRLVYSLGGDNVRVEEVTIDGHRVFSGPSARVEGHPAPWRESAESAQRAHLSSVT